ncbi:MAG TPA: YihY/virulence factor BrkB family protein [Bryobacteraceae bacterium]|nr:YihY/virulence factor BrkB family protein [Bryobacteraceae bacterium]
MPRSVVMWEPGGTEAETAAGSARRYRKPLKCLRWGDFKVLLLDTIDQFYDDNAPRLGAAVAFYTMLSLAPLLVVAIAVAGLAFGEQAARGQIYWQIQELVGSEGALAIQRLVENARAPSTGVLATVLGLATLFFGATTAVAELRDALNTIWEVPPRQAKGLASVLGLLRERFFSFTLVVGVGFLLVVSLLVNAVLAAAGKFVNQMMPLPETVLQTTSSVLSFVVITLLFALIYKVLPDLHVEWQDVVLGAAVTSLLFTLGKLAIGLYLGKTAIASTYGAAGSLVIVLVWVYYSVQVFFLGAAFTHVYATTYGSGTALKSRRFILGKRKIPEVKPGEDLITPA